jgi:hypothetical protein
MRTFIWTIVVLVTFNLLTSNCTLAQDNSQAKHNDALAAAKAGAQATAGEAQQQAQKALKQAYTARERAAILAQQLRPDALAYSRSVAATPEDEAFSINLLQRAAQSILVVPADEINPEDLAAITEDLGIMCRVLDKKLE